MEEKWFDNQDQLKIKIGIIYDTGLSKQYPDIDERLAKNNQNMCNVMYMEFDAEDEEMKPD